MARQSDVYIDIDKLKQGLYALEDTTKAPVGSARIMRNIRITDRGGVAPRLGTELLGSLNSGSTGVRGLYNFRKSYDSDEFLLKAYDDELEVYSKNHSSAGWFRLKNGFEVDSEFGFGTTLVNTLAEDYTVFSNRYQPYQRWQGSVTLLNGALAGGEAALTVDSVLTDEIFESKTASASSATTLDISPAVWFADMWIGMYVYITSGVHSGKIRLISANTTSQITFATLGSDPGSCTFEIRKAAFPATGTLIYGGTTIAYTAIPTATTFTVASAHAGSDNAAVALVPTEYPGAPRGNRIANYLGRMIVGNVRSALARNAGGTLQGFASAGSYFVSKIADPTDFGFSGTRVAGEGDIISTPHGGGDITDVVEYEDAAYVFKPGYIESVQYSQDSNDLANRAPLKAGVGSVGQVIKGSDDLYFVTRDKKFTSLGRVVQKDLKPQTENIGSPIKRLLDDYEFYGRGIEYKDRIYLPARSSSTVDDNDVLVVYNKRTSSFDGLWDINANFIEQFNGRIYYGESTTPNVYLMEEGHADVVGSDRYPISAAYASHFMNLTPSHANTQAVNSLYVEGYIREGSEITFEMWKDFATDSFLSFTFDGTEAAFTEGAVIDGYLGGVPLGLVPLGSLGEADEEGRVHYQFRVYFPWQYGNHFSFGFSSSDTDIDYEVTRFGLGLMKSVTLDSARVKTV